MRASARKSTDQIVNDDPLLTRPQLAEYLNVTERQVVHLTQTGQIAVTKIGRLVRVRQSAADSYIERQTQGALR